MYLIANTNLIEPKSGVRPSQLLSNPVTYAFQCLLKSFLLNEGIVGRISHMCIQALYFMCSIHKASIIIEMQYFDIINFHYILKYYPAPASYDHSKEVYFELLSEKTNCISLHLTLNALFPTVRC